jgi:hypothetical protein
MTVHILLSLSSQMFMGGGFGGGFGGFGGGFGGRGGRGHSHGGGFPFG